MFTSALTIDTHILFDTGDGIYALPRKAVSGVTPRIDIRESPNKHLGISGIADWKGTDQIVLCIASLLGRARPAFYSNAACHLIMLSDPYNGLALAGHPVTIESTNPVFDLNPSNPGSESHEAIIGAIDFPDGRANVLDMCMLIPRTLRADILRLIEQFGLVRQLGSPPVKKVGSDTNPSRMPDAKGGLIASRSGKRKEQSWSLRQ